MQTTLDSPELVSSTDRLASLLANAHPRSPMVWLGLYDSAFAALAVAARADGIVVGDSVGPNALGLESMEQVTLDHMVHHASAVRRGAPTTPMMVDLPIQTQRLAPQEALTGALRLWRETKADAIKLEGSSLEVASLAAALVREGVTVCAHLVRAETSIEEHSAGARAFKDARVSAAVLQGFSPDESEALRRESGVPVIGVEQRARCDGVVINAYRALGILPVRPSPSASSEPSNRPGESLRHAVEAARRTE